MNAERQNSERQFLELVDANRLKVLKICHVYARNPADRDDLYQEILFQIWRSLPSLKAGGYANTWLYRIALNTSISFVRKQATQYARTVACDQEQMSRMAEFRQPERTKTDEQLADLYVAIAKLDNVEKALVTLFLEDLSYEQIAEVMGLSVPNVGVMLHRAKKKLSSLMTEEAPK